jgi:hypothetical protein
MKEKLKNLYNKKGVKIAIRIINMLVYGFAIFMIVLLSVGSCSNQYNEQPQKEAVPVHDVINFTDNLRGYSLPELLCSSDTYEYLYTRYTNYFNNAVTDMPNVYNGYDNTQLSYYASFSNVDLDDYGWVSPGNRIQFNSLKIYCTSTGTATGLANSLRYKSFYICLYNQNSSQSYEVGGRVYFDLIFPAGAWSATDEYINHTWSIKSIQGGVIDYFIAIFKSNKGMWDIMTGDEYENGYVSGQADGYSSGYTNGYNEGDTAGYNRGYTEGAQHNEANIFSIIQQGFSSITSLFNIQIFPGITLATLFFIPMIVVIVIALMHIFKG